MAECRIKFSEPASKETISQLVIDYLKYMLYYRGQFPMPLDQLKKSIESLSKESSEVKIDNNPIYADYPEQICISNAVSRTSNIVNNRGKQKFEDIIYKFDEFFKQLLDILLHKDVLQVIMNLGPNMMSPKELHCIKLPVHCTNSHCIETTAPFHKCRLQFFKSIMHNVFLEDFKSDVPLPISVLLQLKKGASITESMEMKRFYAAPTKCHQVTVRFDDTVCEHICSTKCDDSSGGQFSSDVTNSGPWVKLKAELKGFKYYSETKRPI